MSPYELGSIYVAATAAAGSSLIQTPILVCDLHHVTGSGATRRGLLNRHYSDYQARPQPSYTFGYGPEDTERSQSTRGR